MKIFIDTANVEEIREAASWGILSGVTTNPSLIAKEAETSRQSFRKSLRSLTVRSAQKFWQTLQKAWLKKQEN